MQPSGFDSFLTRPDGFEICCELGAALKADPRLGELFLPLLNTSALLFLQQHTHNLGPAFYTITPICNLPKQIASLTLGLESLEDVREDADAPEPGDAVGVELGHRVPDDPLLLRLLFGSSVLVL